MDRSKCVRLLAAVFCLVTVGCGDSDPTNVVTELTFSMSGTGTVDGQDFAPGFPGGRSDFDGRCSVPSDFVIRFTVVGTATIGPVTSTLEHCSQFDPQSMAATITDGVQVIRGTALAEELWAIYRSPDDPDSPFDEVVEFTGGTGRFIGASGEGTVLVQCDQATGSCDYDLQAVVVLGPS